MMALKLKLVKQAVHCGSRWLWKSLKWDLVYF
jgi:hypothetical protein